LILLRPGAKFLVAKKRLINHGCRGGALDEIGVAVTPNEEAGIAKVPVKWGLLSIHESLCEALLVLWPESNGNKKDCKIQVFSERSEPVLTALLTRFLVPTHG
jgi:hypothetical protein